MAGALCPCEAEVKTDAVPPQYDVEELAEQGDFNDSAYLLLHGELPSPEQKVRPRPHHALAGARAAHHVRSQPRLRAAARGTCHVAAGCSCCKHV